MVLKKRLTNLGGILKRSNCMYRPCALYMPAG